MGRIRDYLALLVIVQFLIFLPVISAYPQHDAKPMGWWQFDEGVGSSTSDASGNGNHLVVKTDRVSWVAGKFGQGAEMGDDPWSGGCFSSETYQ